MICILIITMTTYFAIIIYIQFLLYLSSTYCTFSYTYS